MVHAVEGRLGPSEHFGIPRVFVTAAEAVEAERSLRLEEMLGGHERTEFFARGRGNELVERRGCGENHRRPDLAAGEIIGWKRGRPRRRLQIAPRFVLLGRIPVLRP